MPSDPTHLPDDPDQWVDLYGDRLFRFAQSRIGDPATAEDLVQDTLLAALKSRKRFQGRASVHTWLMAILKHKIVDHYRKMSRRRQTETMDTDSAAFDALFNAKGQWKAPPARWAFTPGKHLEAKAFMDALYRCLAQLPERLARIFELREIDGLKGEELCRRMDVSPANSWVMLHRARMRLRSCLEADWRQDRVKIGEP